MALVAFLRGVNVGGHRTFRPSELARELGKYDVVSIGAAGTFVVRKPGSRARFRSALRGKLPFETVVALCDGRDLVRLERHDPFAGAPARPDMVPFMTVLTKTRRVAPPLPAALPPVGKWHVRIIAARKQFAFGWYRRHMKTIGYLGQLDKLFDVPTTTRNWSTVLTVIRILKADRTNRN